MKRDSGAGIGVVEAVNKGMHVTPEGTVIGVRGKPLSCNIGTNGYFKVSITCNGKRVVTEVHKLVAYQKFGESVFDDGVHIRHLNGHPLDNRWDNIALGTVSENSMDRDKKTRLRVARQAAAVKRRFTMDTIRDIRRKREQGYTLQNLADEFESTKGHMSDIVNRKLYPED
jgi:hypothetical protein